MQVETRNWISKANKDLVTAEFAMHSMDGPLPVTTALHCQQSAKKYLKAFLYEQHVPFSSQSGLVTLLESCISVDNSFEQLRQLINKLEGYSIASRYPKANESLEFRKEALATIEQVKEFVLSRLT
ncbi:MAG TPA: HEPN domain-containing protein [Anaerolineales bacterium]|nr:HEPN domain-containing protein [Anaerolineales bacterium]